MDNFVEILIYLLIIVGSGLIQYFRNKKKDQQQQPTNPPLPSQPRQRREVSSPEADTTSQRPSRRPASFEDILREMMGAPQETPPEPEPYQPPVRKRQPQKEREDYSAASDTYQKAMKQANKVEKLDDRIDLENLDEFIKPRFDSYQTKTKSSKFTREVKAMLRNPESAKKAVLLSEILNRKHF